MNTEHLSISTDALEMLATLYGIGTIVKALTLVVGSQYQREQEGEDGNDLATVLDALIAITDITEHIDARRENRGNI